MVVQIGRPVHYAITDVSSSTPKAASGGEAMRSRRLHHDLSRWREESVDFVQLREKGLLSGELFRLATLAVATLQADPVSAQRPRVLINSRADIAVAAKADGVHLTSRPGELRPSQVRQLFTSAGLRDCTISVSCHTLPEVAAARREAADLILFSPVFGKDRDGVALVRGAGLEALREACSLAAPVPVLALGRVTLSDEPDCLAAGAAGIAGIRLFAAPLLSEERTLHPAWADPGRLRGA